VHDRDREKDRGERAEGLKADHHPQAHDYCGREWEQEEKRSGEIGSGEGVAGADRIEGERGARALAWVTAIGVDDEPAERVDAEENGVGSIGAVSDADLEAVGDTGELDVETNHRSAFAAQCRCDVDGGGPGEIETEGVDGGPIDR
jgi:hypothetical protein